jgi:hypothetical protein
MSLLQELVIMQSQLQEATIEGELDLFIQDQHKDLNRLFTATITELHNASNIIKRLDDKASNIIKRMENAK